MAESIAIRELRDDERAWANERYRAIEFGLTPPGSVALVAERGGARIGLGRLIEYAPGVVELGGIWTEEAMRRAGVARAMVRALLARPELAGLARSGAGSAEASLGGGGGPGARSAEASLGGGGLHAGSAEASLGGGGLHAGSAEASLGGGGLDVPVTRRLWCIPFVHLDAFYQSFGFAPAPPPWPEAIAAKVADCVAHQQDVVVLVR